MRKNQLFLFILCIVTTSSILHATSPFDNLSLDNNRPKLATPFQQTHPNAQPSHIEVVSYTPEEISANLQKILTTKSAQLNQIHNKTLLKRLYRQNNYQPLWIEQNGFGTRASSLLRSVENDITITTKSNIYQEYLFLSKYMKDKDIHKDLFSIELRLSQLHLDLLEHTLYGSINWKDFARKLSAQKSKRIYANWVNYQPRYNLSELMLQPDVEATLQEITPKNFGYSQLLQALKKLKQLEQNGGWEKLPRFKRLALGDQGDNVIKLRERLKQSGDYTACEQSSEQLFESEPTETVNTTFQPEAVFGECLDRAVKTFQRRHGLEEDGIVGLGTQEAMNESVQSKIQRVLLNIDRIKWLPRDLTNRYLIVNIPDYMLYFIEDNQVKEEMAVIVGDKRHPTPIFTNEISFIVLNPYWKVPDGIVKREIIPAMIKDPNYLTKEGLEIHTTWSEDSPLIDPSWIYWGEYYRGIERFPYRIMQPPGNKNALGKIKFKFPNQFDVYLHDTPTKHLFPRSQRAFSHGCIRISKPYGLLETIAGFNQNIDMQKVDKILKGKKERHVNISNKLPIHIVYLTAGYNPERDELLFRNDVYQYDKMQNVDKY